MYWDGTTRMRLGFAVSILLFIAGVSAIAWGVDWKFGPDYVRQPGRVCMGCVSILVGILTTALSIGIFMCATTYFNCTNTQMRIKEYTLASGKTFCIIQTKWWNLFWITTQTFSKGEWSRYHHSADEAEGVFITECNRRIQKKLNNTIVSSKVLPSPNCYLKEANVKALDVTPEELDEAMEELDAEPNISHEIRERTDPYDMARAKAYCDPRSSEAYKGKIVGNIPKDDNNYYSPPKDGGC